MKKNSKLIIISGPSGVGKTTIVNLLLEKHADKLERPLTYTTRPPRQYEKAKDEYVFVSVEDFKKMIKKNSFIEWDQVYGNYYGKSLAEINEIWETDKIPVLTIDPMSIDKKEFKQPYIIKIFLTAKDIQNIENRLRKRKIPHAKLQKRLKLIPKELKMAKEADFIIINEENRIRNTVSECEKIIFEKA